MKNFPFEKIKKANHLQKWNSSQLYSAVVEEVLNLTYPNFQKLFPFKKEELYRLIFNYFFNDGEAIFFEIETFTNLITACNLEGFKIIIRKNGLNSFQEFDEYMIAKKARSFDKLTQSLPTHEVLDEGEKNKIIGGKKSKNQLLIYFAHYEMMSA